MNCLEFQNWLQQRLDGETAADGADIERHLAVCSSCRELRAAAIRMVQVLDGQIIPAPPDGMSDRIVSQILNEVSVRQQARKRWNRRLTAALAASLLLAACLGYWWQSHRRPGAPNPETVAKTEEKPAPASAPPSLNIQEAGSTLVALVNRTADETLSPGRVLLPQRVQTPDLAKPEAWQPTLESDAQTLREAQEGVAVGFEPVTSSARRAVNLFLREIPPMQTSKQ